MEYTCHYASPLGGITLASDGEALTGLWFDGQKYFADTLDAEHGSICILPERSRISPRSFLRAGQVFSTESGMCCS